MSSCAVFLLHLLPKGFVRIRHFGFLANRRRATLLPLCFQLLGALQPSPTEPEPSPAQEPSPLWLCPKCSGRMVVIERLTAAQLQLVLRPFWLEPLHETTIPTSPTWCPSPPAGVVRTSGSQNAKARRRTWSQPRPADFHVNLPPEIVLG